jgi:hypothetical protein
VDAGDLAGAESGILDDSEAVVAKCCEENFADFFFPKKLVKVVLEIITFKANAFDGPIPGCFTDVMAHMKEVEVILKKWEEGIYTHMVRDVVAHMQEVEVIIKTIRNRRRACVRKWWGILFKLSIRSFIKIWWGLLSNPTSVGGNEVLIYA